MLPLGDVILHAGDVCDQGNVAHVDDFLDWFGHLDYTHKILVRGNHDIDLSTGRSLLEREMPDGVVQLCDAPHQIEDVLIWGSPFPLHGESHDWTSIDSQTRLLVTHQPPYEILDRPWLSTSKGKRELLKAVQKIKPEVHLFGHIHAGYGQVKTNETLFINASLYKASKKRIVNAPIEFELG